MEAIINRTIHVLQFRTVYMLLTNSPKILDNFMESFIIYLNFIIRVHYA